MRIIPILIALLLLSPYGFAQSQTVKTIIPQNNPVFAISIEHENDFQQHCNVPLQYKIHKSGTVEKNSKFQWTFQYIPCGSSKVLKQSVTFLVPKGSGEIDKVVSVKATNIITRYDDNSFVQYAIDNPQFTISAPKSVMEGDNVNLSIDVTKYSSPQAHWYWYKGNKSNQIASGTSIQQVLTSTTTFFVRNEVEGFYSDFIQITVPVIKRPDAPSSFAIDGPSSITDIETADLSITPNTDLENVRWVWEADNSKIAEGLSISVNPKRTTTYYVHSEYYGKKSPRKSFQVQVTILPEPPSDFDIVAPKSIIEGQKAWIKVKNDHKAPSIKWKWTDNDNKQYIGDSIEISPGLKTVYKVYADLNGKKSNTKNVTVDVIILPAAAKVVGDFKKCNTNRSPSKFTATEGKLGSYSTTWNWYEGKCGSGKFIGSGTEIYLNPPTTTTYYVHPNNNPEACTPFTFEISSPSPLPDKIVFDGTACQNSTITVRAVGELQQGSQWKWYTIDAKTSRLAYKGYGDHLTDIIEQSTTYIVRSENASCLSEESRRLYVPVKRSSDVPYDVVSIQQKGRKYELRVMSTYLSEGSRWTWYQNSFLSSPIGYGDKLAYRAKKENHLVVRAEGICDTTIGKELSFQWRKVKGKFIFINFGLSNNTYVSLNDIQLYNANLSIGSNRVYIRGQIPLSSIMNNDTEHFVDLGELETDGKRVVNYPSSSSNTYYRFNGNRYSECYSIRAGILAGGNKIKFYVGAGYGIRELYWGIDVYDNTSNLYLGMAKAKFIQQSVSGPSAECGLFLRLKAINIMGGADAIIGASGNMYGAAHIGVGFNFNR